MNPTRRTRVLERERSRSDHREPSAIEIAIGLCAFVVLVALCLYGAAALGR